MAENDEFWGPGFTEWRNVAAARPLFPGHYQPRVPADLGYYDLRLPETQIDQAALAQRYGIGAFCYYHYWFDGRVVLGRPLQQMLANDEIDLPFFVCWANENWTRRWDGLDEQVLLAQRYTPEDDLAHIRWLLPVLADARYLRIDDEPVVLVYRARQLPDPRATADRWREEASKAGIGSLHLCAVESFTERGEPSEIGFDAAVQFQPAFAEAGPPIEHPRHEGWFRSASRRGQARVEHIAYSYEAVARRMMGLPNPPYRRYPCVAPSWDNTSRRKHGAILLDGATPALYEEWLRDAVGRAASTGAPLVFINAWNEWAEGAYLEPDLRFGHEYLEATARAVQSATAGTTDATG